ncbi:hypothetical protein FOZ60_010448 [Perkinsus olseni]|uniref:Protein kinase domain-containing protein n=1 Tax=Perkinsus olseni TaxID=32597 RepID=A0A7J6NF87_PEROL|nr:hypothetical protein FOZ60_010448 [Perkinsus olseni]
MTRVAVGPYVKGSTGEVYELIEQLQSALFGGVYRARGLSTGKDYAVKVLHKRELARIQREAKDNRNIEFCEMPLSEVTFASKMRENDHVLELLDHSEDDHCHYLASPLARGGDLLESLKEVSSATDGGFQERVVKSVVAEAAQGIAYLHRHGLALQDVSLENMLLFVEPESGNYTVKICDPGQATEFSTDNSGREELIRFKGLVGKSFRPPELYSRRDYIATAVDSWCLGWSIFYLLTARSLFQSADPRGGDKDWAAFSSGDVDQLFRRKGARHLSQEAKELILELMQLDPRKRLSVRDALWHPWFADSPSPSRWPAPSHLVIEEREMVERVRARKAAAMAASNGGSVDAPANAETVEEATVEAGSHVVASSPAERPPPRRSEAPRRPREERSDEKDLPTAKIVGYKSSANSPLYGSTPCFVSPRSPRLANAIALNAYHTRLCRSPSPPPQRVPCSSVPNWTTVLDNMNARARSPSPRIPPSPMHRPTGHHQQSPAAVTAYSPDPVCRMQYRGTAVGQTPFFGGNAALRSRSPSFMSLQGSPLARGWMSPMPGSRPAAASPPLLRLVGEESGIAAEMAGTAFSPDELRGMMQLFESNESSGDNTTRGSVGPSNAAPNQKVSIKSAAQMRRDQQAREAAEEAKRDAIWDGDDFKKHSGVAMPEASAGGADKSDPRPAPEYEILYRQELSANDMFLNLHDTDPSSDRCTDITVKIYLPNTQLKDISLDVLRERILLQAPKYRLSLPLPYAVDEEKGNAKWDKLRGCLSVTLPMIRDVKYVTDPRAAAVS